MSSGTTTKQVIWPYQESYRVNAQTNLEIALTTLDKRLKPDVFLVGILADGDTTKFAAGVEPGSEYWVQSEDFHDALTQAIEIRSWYKENGLKHSSPTEQKQQDEDLYRRSVRDAIESTTKKKLAGGLVPSEVYVSIPQRVREYLVSVVAILPKEVLKEYYALQTATVCIDSHHDVIVTKCLVEAVIHVLFELFYEELDGSDPGSSTPTFHHVEDILRNAGREFMFGLACRVEMQGGTFHSFYDHICRISAMKYEQRESRGMVIVAKKDHPVLSNRLVFDEPVPLGDTRHVRKLLELGSQHGALHINHEDAFGLVENVDVDCQDESIFSIRILGHHSWDVRYGRDVLMGSRDGQPYLHKVERFEVTLKEDLPRIFSDISVDDAEQIVALVKQAAKATHGAMIVISGNAKAEATRLKAQSTAIESVQLNTELLSDIIEIDGAILIDATGCCHAIGVILDGMATEHGDRSRGSRYNSALKYVQSGTDSAIPTMAIVISEDGTVDTIPFLRPRIRKSVLTALMKKLQSFKDGPVSVRNYNQTLDGLNGYRFYLQKEDSDLINELTPTIERKLKKESPGTALIEREPFVPNAEMNPESYFVAG